MASPPHQQEAQPEAGAPPAPRLCHLIKWADFDGYGFNLHAERANPGQYIGKIDEGSPARLAGLREGDRIVAVNGLHVAELSHRQVVERIKALETETRLLVVDARADAWHQEHQLPVTCEAPNLIYMRTPVPRPEPDSPRALFHAEPASPQTGARERQPAPMSPDSGRGDEEPARGSLTVEAEMNRQSPTGLGVASTSPAPPAGSQQPQVSASTDRT